jgi:phosphatidate cytidylyltransferase
MLTHRLIVAILFIPLGVFVIATGGWLFAVVVAAGLTYGAWEYWNMFRHGGYHPSGPVLIVGVAAVTLARMLPELSGVELALSVVTMAAMAMHLFQYEKAGDRASAIDFNITVGGVLYLGWLGSYLVSLRALPDGLWWVLLVLPGVWMADGAAYFVGRKFGKHKMSRYASPKKSWEGYIGGLIAAALFCLLLASLWHLRAPAITPLKGLILGLMIGLLGPVGDLGESMLKRGFGVKDTSQLLPGHGGIMDRIDSWLVVAPVGYFLILYALA